ncbi:putative U3 small nucleolar RNA-associated protein 13 [Hypsizygus marmoreus]|uniref:U3 small nucleolar RNA-associated protein 13 n=1 Tax=Hypsizygus marmoreus TaxID=39966 RepID=A0A369KEF6_HYPMA|nr:putative U3 small nucleolar RNA-associated protein 13 [Hypsizygus marmoreus]
MAVPTGRPKLKTAFKNVRSIGPLYTGGPVAITADGKRIVTCVSENILLTDISTGVEICRFSGDTQAINSLCISPSSTHLLVFTASLSLRIFELPADSTPLKKLVHPTRVISRAHDAPVHVCKVDPTSTYLASGSADGVVKIWDIRNGYITHVFKGHGGVVSALAFNYPQDLSSVTREQKMHLITASVDTRIRIFDLSTSNPAGGGKSVAVLEGHYSVPRGLDVSLDGKWLVSGGRDSVVLIWDLSSQPSVTKSSSGKSKGKDKAFVPTLVKTIPVLERVEAVGILHPDEDLTGSTSGSEGVRFYTGGEKGLVKIWDSKDAKILFTLGKEQAKISDDQEEQRQIVDVVYLPSTSTVVSIHADQNIIFHSLSTQSLTRQLIGYNDEIVDVTFLSPDFSMSSNKTSQRDTHIALATNSALIRVYNTQSFDARLLEGHTDVVLALDHGVSGRLLASGSKDRSARVWAPLQSKLRNEADWGYGCVCICEGHAESVGAIALSRKAGTEGGADHPEFMFTGSQDRTIKMWDLAGVPMICEEDDEGKALRCKSLTTHKAHEKDINALDVSPNDKLLVSGSQDRTAKIFAIEYSVGIAGRPARGELKLIGTCKGHKRGVWTVRFGRTERVLATGSGDKTVKLWSLDDFSCLKTFEGHTNSVLRVDFVNAGLQLVSAASDGLVKLWNIREEECVATMDNHEDKVWALAVSTDESRIVSGAADSIVTFWQDCTEEQEAEKETNRAEMVLKEQEFLNYLSLNDYRKAIQLALAMEQPGRLLSLFRNIQTTDVEENSITGRSSVDEVIRTLGGSDLAKLLRFARDWNTNAKTSRVAQGVLYAIVKLKSADDLMKAFKDDLGEAAFAQGEVVDGKTTGTALKELVDALIPYTERHLSRMNKLVQESYMVDYILGEMDDGMFDVDEMDVDIDVAII